MTRYLSLACVVPLLMLAACTSAEDRAARSQEDVDKRRMELIDQHQECVEEADGDQQKLEVCEQYLKEADALQ